MSSPLLAVRGLTVRLARPGRGLFARPQTREVVSDVSFDIPAGETLGLVGESGSGKSTLARAVLGLIPVDSGTVSLNGVDWTALGPAALRAQRRHAQMVFQHPHDSFDPRRRIGDSIREPLDNFPLGLTAAQKQARVAETLDQVALNAGHARRLPHELSGGQCQRAAIARALVLRPGLLVCDEPVSALDVSVRAQIVNLFADLQRDLGLSLLFIAHDLAIVRRISARVLVLYAGRTMETGLCDSLYSQPQHPCTQAMLAAVPVTDPDVQRARIAALDPASPLPPPASGACAYRSRCPRAQTRCAQERPDLSDRKVSLCACHFPGP